MRKMQNTAIQYRMFILFRSVVGLYSHQVRSSTRFIEYCLNSNQLSQCLRARPWLSRFTVRRSLTSFKVNAAWLSLYSSLHLVLFTSTAESKGEIEKMESNVTALILEADDLFNQNKFADIYELLNDLEETTNVEVLWRISRALYNMAKEDKTAKRQELIRSAFNIIRRALELDDHNFAVHKWYAILLDENGALDGIKARVSVSMKFKEHMLRATELNPKDATSLYVLGSWCFAIAELPWYQRKIAAALFAAPPTSSYEEALIYFCRAEEVEPNFYSRNLLMLGKTYLRLKVMDKAIHYLSTTVLRPARTDDDHQATKEAEELLKHIKT